MVMSELSGEARGGMFGGGGGLLLVVVIDGRAAKDLLGELRGGREGGLSSDGDTDLTVFTEAVEDIESLLEARLIDFDGLIGDRLVSRSSEDVLISLLFSFEAIDFTWILCTGAVVVILLFISIELLLLGFISISS